MKNIYSISTVCIMLIFSSLGFACNQVTGKAKAANTEDGTLVIKKCQDFKVTGNGGSDAWKGTSWVKLNNQGPDYASYETRVIVLYSETGIYFLFVC